MIKKFLFISLGIIILNCLVSYTKIIFIKPNGYDISHHNKNIKWDKFNVQFVYLKATQGTTFIDPKYNEYLNTAKQYNIKVGAYHFMDPKLSGEKQFNHFKSVVGKRIDLIPVLDVEVPGISNEDILEFVCACEKYYGVKPMIYANVNDYIKHQQSFQGCKWWISQKIPIVIPFNYHMWQYTIKDVNGTQLDHNYINPKYTITDFIL